MQLIWYFDFISPFAYLQQKQLATLPDGIEIEYRPILFAGLLNHWQNVGPAEVPPKRQYTYHYCQWLAQKSGVLFKMPPAHPFNSLYALRTVIALGNSAEVVNQIFNFIWRDGLDINAGENLHLLEERLGIKNLSALISAQAVKDKLYSHTQTAAATGVFGVPCCQIQHPADPGQQVRNFWGVDGFAMLLDYLKQPTMFETPEMQRVSELPEGVQRRRS